MKTGAEQVGETPSVTTIRGHLQPNSPTKVIQDLVSAVDKSLINLYPIIQNTSPTLQLQEAETLNQTTTPLPSMKPHTNTWKYHTLVQHTSYIRKRKAEVIDTWECLPS